MRRGVKAAVIWPAVVATAMAVAACAKTDKQEHHAEIVGGTDKQVRILAGVSASPLPLARSYCANYQKNAYLRDSEPAGFEYEAYITGSQPYLYTYDCF